MKRILFLALLGVAFAPAQPAKFDAIIRNGAILDGSGNPRFEADIAIRSGLIVEVGKLPAATAPEEIDARGMFVAPGFINIHSHASPDALATAVNMLTQGVTTEIFNADGSGAVDLAAQMVFELVDVAPVDRLGARDVGPPRGDLLFDTRFEVIRHLMHLRMPGCRRSPCRRPAPTTPVAARG